jgi:hypothetical protein
MTHKPDLPEGMTTPVLRRPGWQRWIVSWLRRFFNPKINQLHRDLFAWHCKTFFPFDQHLHQSELDYLHACIDLSELYPETHIDTGYEEYSYFTYSHRIVENKANSSRMAFGSLSYPHESLEAAMPVFEHRQLDLDTYFLTSPNSLFYGIGWDILACQFKVYFRILVLDQLPQASLQPLLVHRETMSSCRQEGLVSFTYHTETGALHEEKVYLYPEPEVASTEMLFPGTKGRVVMATSKRGALTQYDVSAAGPWLAKMNQTGHDIIAQYKTQGYPLDTITMQDRDHYTLYFPGAFMPFVTRPNTPST